MSQHNLQALLSRLETDNDQIAIIFNLQSEMSNMLNRVSSDFEQKMACFQGIPGVDAVREFRRVPLQI
jgi:hypothetical protein